MQRRAQGISVNVIIIAAIALVVMVILVALVINQGGVLNTGSSSCEIDGAECVAQNVDCPQGYVSAVGRTCGVDSATPKCCIPLS